MGDTRWVAGDDATISEINYIAKGGYGQVYKVFDGSPTTFLMSSSVGVKRYLLLDNNW